MFKARHCRRHQTYFEKLNYKFTLNPAIDYAFCYAHSAAVNRYQAARMPKLWMWAEGAWL
jgi:hypothetical protein